MGYRVTFRCAAGHSQTLHYGVGFTEDMVHDHAVLIAGGTLRSIGAPMPGYPCAWPVDGDGDRQCGAKLSFELVEEANEVPEGAVRVR